MNDEIIEELAGRVQQARRMVIFTGAGVSTDSGIPDFRSPGGFWTKHKPIEYREFLSSPETRKEAWTRFFAIHDTITKAVPGETHRAIARLAERGNVARVITQNIDGLHQRAGVPHDQVIEIHGNGSLARCLSCGARHEIAEVREAMMETGEPPACGTCGGIVKSATISFGQAMPEQEMADSRAATLDADLFFAVGSSLQVFPAAGFPVTASHNHTPLVIINREPTGLDGLAQLVIHADAGPVLGAVVAKLAN
ncbi:SIR2 family NAD-dependent protein deacylase [Aestuariivirga sp.]|uniref:SIR2 family NAD-dependent protein deacylase n=1 Tax=Aestuariivirga sp. TaxID=2650926 RepID=UPI0039E46292